MLKFQSLKLAKSVNSLLEFLEEEKRISKRFSLDALLLISSYIDSVVEGKENHGVLILSLIELFNFTVADAVRVDMIIYKDFNEAFNLSRKDGSKIELGNKNGPSIMEIISIFEKRFSTIRFFLRNPKALRSFFWYSSDVARKFNLPLQQCPLYAINTPTNFNRPNGIEGENDVINHLFYVLGRTKKIIPVIGMTYQTYVLKKSVHFYRVFGKLNLGRFPKPYEPAVSCDAFATYLSKATSSQPSGGSGGGGGVMQFDMMDPVQYRGYVQETNRKAMKMTTRGLELDSGPGAVVVVLYNLTHPDYDPLHVRFAHESVCLRKVRAEIGKAFDLPIFQFQNIRLHTVENDGQCVRQLDAEEDTNLFAAQVVPLFFSFDGVITLH